MSSTSVLLVILLDCLMLCQGNRPRVTYRDRGTMTKLYLPKPPADRISQIMFRNTTLFYASFGEIDGASVTQDGVRVRLTNTNAVLMINRVDFIHAGPYFIKMLNGNITGREKLLVVTDTPMNPHIKADTVSPVVPEAVTLCCNSTSRSKPDTHDLTLRFTWRINGTLATQLRFSANSSCLIIKSTVPNDRYNKFTCQAIEETQGYSGPPSMESDEFQLTPRYGPQFVDIDGAGSLSPMIMGDVCCPVVCSTDCNPSCVIEWWREGVLLPVHQTSDNQSRLLDKCPTKTREITYTCKVRLPENVGFTASMMERNFTVSVYYPPKITNMMYFDETDQFQPINTSDVITLPEAIKLVLRVDVDSNPNSDVTLLHGQHIVGTGVANGTTGRFSIHVDNLQCIHTGTYVVRATNFFKEKITAVHHSEGLFGLHVSCVPRVVRSTNRTVGLTRERYTAIPINVTVIANPSPSFEWSEGVSSLPVLKANLYTYIISGIVEAKTMAEYREDHVNITNGLGQVLTVKFQIRPEDLPYTPGDFHVSKVGIEYITVGWTSNFNGGYPQMFDIYVMIVGDDGWEPGILNISDVGQGTRMECIIGELMPNTEYILRLDVSNKLGSGHSTQLRYWTLAPPRITVLRFQCETYIHLFQVRGTLISVTPPEADRCDIMVDINSNTTTEVILLYEQQTVARAEATHTAGTYRIHLNNLRCNQTGEYIVRASKSFRDNSDDAYRYDQPFELRVACSPRILSTSNRTIGLTSGRYNAVPINVTVIANPSPSSDWSEGVSSLPVLKTNLYTYIIRGIVEAKTVTEYREDHVNITNGLGQVLTVTFQIRSEGVPQTPTDFRVAKVGVNSITVTWTSVFDGGYLQIFDIYIMAVEDEGWRPGVLGIPDPGQGTLMEHTIGNLTSYTEYILRLGVSNKLGSGNSTQLRYWTLDVPQKIFKLPFIILTVSLGILIIATIIIIIRITTHQKAKQDRCPDQGPTINHALHPITDPSNSNHDHVYASVDGEVSVQTTGTRHRAETEEITRHQYFYASVNEGSLNSRTRNLHGNEDDTAVATDGDRQYLEIIEMRGSEDDTATATAGERQYLEIIEMKESEGGADSFHYLQMDKPKDNIDGMSLDADMQYIEMGASEGGTKVLTASDTNDIMYDREEGVELDNYSEKRHLYLKPKAPRPVTNIKTSDEEDNTEVKVPVGDGNEYTKLKIQRDGEHLYGVRLAQLEANSAIPDVDTEEAMTETLTNQKGDSDSDYDEAVSK